MEEKIFYTQGIDKFSFDKNNATLFFLQKLRDEVHRFAIAGHRLKSKKIIFKNPLDEIRRYWFKKKEHYLTNLVLQKQLKQLASET